MAKDQGLSDRPSLGRFIREHGPSVIASLVASFLFLYLLDPILAFLGRSLLSVSALLNQAYLNRIYAQAAHLESHDFAFLIVAMVSGTVGALPMLIGVLLLRRSLAVRSQKIESDRSQNRQIHRHPGVGTTVSICLIGLLFFGWGAVVIGANYVQLSLISSFKQHIRIVAPYLSDEEEESLISEWSRMASKTDYDRIYEKLVGIAQREGVSLPDNKLYSPFAL